MSRSSGSISTNLVWKRSSRLYPTPTILWAIILTSSICISKAVSKAFLLADGWWMGIFSLHRRRQAFMTTALSMRSGSFG
jgi:hypothetical protein